MLTKFHRGLTALVWLALALLANLNSQLSTCFAQGTSFTYQGRLNSGGSPANGNYDLAFTLYATNLTGTALAGPVTNTATTVTNGLFTTLVDFGNVYAGMSNWLEIAVSTNGANAFTTLAPRQQLTPAPYALFAKTASNLLGKVSAGQLSGSIPATNLSGVIPEAQLPASVVTNGASGVNISGTFSGNGSGVTNLPGVISWLSVNGTNQQASSNLGFIATNNYYPVLITLPAAPKAGDTFRVAGVGEAGWVLLQNAGQTVLSANLVGTAGVTWYPSGSGTQRWSALCSSADGTKLVAAVGGTGKTGYIYYSTNSGQTWAQSSSPTNYWSALASSADGSKVVATAGTTGSGGSSGGIYTSINFGANWSLASSTTEQWDACASSADGSKLLAVSYNGYIMTSANGGTNWSISIPEGINFTGAASSQDGTKLAICGLIASDSGYVFTTTNGGANWMTQIDSGPGNFWSAIASSADGSHLVATATGTQGGIFTSPDGGVTWVQANQTGVNWTSVASSADGSHLLAGYNGGALTTDGYLYGSVNNGLNWTELLGATNAPWIAVASSVDGGKLAAAAYNGYIYTSGQNVTTSGTNGYLVGTYQSWSTARRSTSTAANHFGAFGAGSPSGVSLPKPIKT